MKANELRIGNIVSMHRYIGNYWSWTFISHEDIYSIACGNEKNYNPIPLTEEWLLKFGAKELNAKRDVLKEFVLKTVRIEMSNSGNFYYKNSKLILESVHQLQNLYFALTGKELTFKSE
jgi:hypothetical protein